MTGRLVSALREEFGDDNSYFVVTPERPRRMRREVQLRAWLIAVSAADVSENRSRSRRH